MNSREYKRNRRRKSIRKKVSGTAERPRMNVFKSNKNIYVQLIDDIEGRTICGVSTGSKDIKSKMKAGTRKNTKFAETVGENIAKTAIEKGVNKVVFDRGGYQYHGVVKAIADSARKHGLEF